MADAPTTSTNRSGTTKEPTAASAEQKLRDAASKTLPADATAEDSGGAAVQEAVQKQLDSETARGYRGIPGDPTPNENYTLAGVTDPNKVTPEERKVQTGKVVFSDVHEDAKK